MKDSKNVMMMILIILVLAMGGYIIYDHVTVKEPEKVEAKKETTKENKTKENKTEEKKEEEKETVDTTIDEKQEIVLTDEEALRIVKEYVHIVNSYQRNIGGSEITGLNLDSTKVVSKGLDHYYIVDTNDETGNLCAHMIRYVNENDWEFEKFCVSGFIASDVDKYQFQPIN